MAKTVKVGIMGGTGVYDPGILKDKQELKVHVPFGPTSDLVIVGKYEGVDVVIIPRHDRYHRLNPSLVNYKANIWAMKEMGVTHIISATAVGSLKEEIRPGELMFPDQFIDQTKGRKSTFYEGAQVCHISVADPFCNNLRKLFVDRAKALKLDHHPKGTCVIIEGPRFSTRAESELFRSWNADIINMTMVPECVLAREAQICYQPIAMVTDYDCWKHQPVDQDMVAKTMAANIDKVKKLLTDVIPRIADEIPEDCSCKHALDGAFV